MIRPLLCCLVFGPVAMAQDGSSKPIYTEMPPALAGYDASKHVSIHDEAEAGAVRRKVIEFLWPGKGLPVRNLPRSTVLYDGSASFPGDLSLIDREKVSRIEIQDAGIDFDYHHLSRLLHPAEKTNADRLVIIHQGHQGGIPDGVGVLADHLLGRGFTVLLMQMPLVGWNADNTFRLPDGETVTIEKRGSRGHDELFDALEGRSGNAGSSIRFFIEPVVAGINDFIERRPDHRDITMIGLSGGGWTTHVAAAVDHRIDLSIPVAGAYPLYLRNHYPGSKGDAEQILPALYEERASWLDLFILAGWGEGRRQIQLLNQFDTCCFYGVGWRTYSGVVGSTVENLGAGKWECVMDSSHRKHQISAWGIEKVIDPALDQLVSE